MALRKRGKNGYWHAYFRAVLSNPDGTLRYALRTVNLGTTDLVTARALEAELMAKNRAARLHQRAEAHMTRLDIEAGLRPASDGSRSRNGIQRRDRPCHAGGQDGPGGSGHHPHSDLR